MISIAMATYNGALYVQKQLDSILNQTIRDFELIICDDYSTDNTWDVLQENANRDNRIHCYRNESNLGFKKNFEKAMCLCSGEFIALSDQDDIWLQNHLEVLLTHIGDNMIVCGDAAIIDENDNRKGITLSDLDCVDFIPHNSFDKAYRIFFNTSIFQGASMLIRRDFLTYAIPVPELVNFHDAWFSALASCWGGLKSIPTIITLHRIHSSNSSSHPIWKKCFFVYYRRRKHFKDRLTMAIEIQKRVPNLPIKTVDFLVFVERYYSRINFKMGRCLNEIFRLQHYSLVYTTRSKVYLEV